MSHALSRGITNWYYIIRFERNISGRKKINNPVKEVINDTLVEMGVVVCRKLPKPAVPDL
jgi:hypothetical protein